MSDIVFHDPPRFPRGFRCASRLVGLKASGKDLALFVSDVDAAAAAVFTRNHFPGAPIILGRETINAGVLRGSMAGAPEEPELRRLLGAGPLEFVVYRPALATARIAAAIAFVARM